MKEKKKLRKSLIAIILVVCCGVCLVAGSANMKVADAEEETQTDVETETEEDPGGEGVAPNDTMTDTTSLDGDASTPQKGYVVTDNDGNILAEYGEENDGIAMLAEKEKIDGVTWEYTLYEGTMDNARYAWTGCSGYGDTLTIPTYYPQEEYSGHVNKIGDELFKNDRTLKTVTVSSGVMYIGDYAFCSSYITSFKGTIYEVGAYAFALCTQLAEMTLEYNQSLSSWRGGNIGDYAFYNCLKLPSISFPVWISSIGDYAFYDCSYYNYQTDDYSDSNFTDITISDSITTIGESAFLNCCGVTSLTIGTSVKTIGAGAFEGCTYISYIYFNAEEMNDLQSSSGSLGGNYVFFECGTEGSGITLTVGAGVKRIPAYLFYSNTISSAKSFYPKIKTVTFSSGSKCESIGEYAFYYLSKLTSVTIPDSVTSIGAYAFYNCSSLTSVTFKSTEGWSVSKSGKQTDLNSSNLSSTSTAATYLTSTYCDYTWSRVGNELVYTLSSSGTYYILSGCTGTFTSVVIDSTYNSLPVKEIDSYVFDGHSEITSVTIPENITTIGSFAFRNCTALTSVKIPDSVTYIGSNAFRGCTALASVTMGDGVETIKDSAFRGCSKLTSITIPESVTFIGSWAFYDCTGLTEIHFNAVNCGDFSKDEDPFDGVGKSGTTLTLYIGAKVTRIPAYMLYCSSGARSNVSVVKFEGVSKCTEAGTNAFADCSALTKLYVEDLASFLAIDFADRYANPLAVVSENKGTFYVNNSSTTKLTITNTASATRLGSYSLAYCTIITDVALGDKVEYIGDHAFEGMSSLATLSLSTYTGWEIYDADGNYAQRIGMMNLTEYSLKYLTSNYVGYTWILSSDSVDGPVITSNIESGKSTNCDFTITVTYDTEIGFAYIWCIYPDGTTALYNEASFTFSFTSGGADDGKYEFVAYDGDGNNSATYIIYVDTVAPEIWANGSIVWKNYDGDSFTVKAEDDIDPEPMLMYSRDGGETWTSYGTNEYTITADSDMHSTDGYWYFMAIDAAGNPSGVCQTILDTVQVFGEWGYYDDETHYMYFSYEAPYYSDWTCTIDGEEYVSGTELTECQKKYVITLTSANGSSHTYEETLDHYYADEGVTVPPTCVEMGYTVQTCARCGDEYYSNFLEACGHSYTGIWVVPATCTTNEVTYIYCTNPDCYSVVSIATTGDALGHDWVADYVTTEPSCTGAGVQHYSCSRDGCNEEKTEPIAAPGHSYEKVVIAPTCTAEGYTTYTCSRCNNSYVDDYEPALGHDLKTETTTTCAGSTDHTYCTREGCTYEYYNEYDSDQYVAHDWSDWTTVEKVDCYKDGSMTRECYICGTVETQVIKAYDHTTETSVYKYDALSVPADGVTVTSSGVTYYVYAGYLTDADGNRYIYNTRTKQTYTTASNPYITKDSKGNQVDTEEDNEDTIIVYYCSLEKGYVCYLASSFMADSVESTGNKLIDLFQKYSKYLWWILLALVVIWSLFIGLRWVLARNDQEKAKSHSMLANYLLGIFVIAIIIVGCPYAIYGIALLLA